jgi:soluble lytic murein transglycosylase-like protein
MGYKGDPKGLLDPQINLTYAVPYLANAYRLADGDEDRAVTLFAAGYYYTARQKNMLASLRTASSPPVAHEALRPQEQTEPQNPLAGALSFLMPRDASPAQTNEQQ